MYVYNILEPPKKSILTKAVARKLSGGGGQLAYCVCVHSTILQGHFYLLCTSCHDFGSGPGGVHKLPDILNNTEVWVQSETEPVS